MSKDPGAKIAPPRNALKKPVLYKNSRATELQGRDPNFVYQYFSTDPQQPSNVDKKLRPHEVGNQASGYATVDGWEIVHSQTDRTARPVDARTDQGKPIDTTHRYGRQILCRIPKDEFAKYQAAEEAYQEMVEKNIYSPDRITDGRNSITTAVSRDDVDPMELLKQSGHPMPGSV
jgi:hypothetical protein